MKYKKGFYDMFTRACGKWPSNIAVRSFNNDKFDTYTYSELYGVCEYICQNLQQLKCTFGLIGLVSERNVIIPCVIAAAHKCSTAFMFLKPTDDINSLINNTKFSIIIVIRDKNIAIETNRKADKTIEIFNFNIFLYVTASSKYVNSFINDYSFIAQTSGSTGEPKQIQVPIQCIQPNIDDMTKLFVITQTDIIYFSTPLTFDPSMVEILLACENGASLLIAPENVDLLCNTEHSVTFWQTTPSRFFQFPVKDIKEKILNAASSLKVLALGGEPLNGVKRLKELKDKENKTRIFTLYGVTEMSCWACLAELDLDKYQNDEDVPLGSCLSETQIEIHRGAEDKNIGNIILVSDTRRCIVLNKVKKPAESRSYIDTGDLGEIRDGTIYYRGRRDDVIKRFGHKVNLQLIETTAMSHLDIISCSCVWIPKKLLLILYYTSNKIVGQELADFLKNKLNENSIPDKVIKIKNLPINDHGKASKECLIKLFEGTNRKTNNFKNDFLIELTSSLDVTMVYNDIKNKDFFSIGGTSILAVTLCNRLSLDYPETGKIVLPHLLSNKNTIGKIIKIAERIEHTFKVRKKRSRLSVGCQVERKKSCTNSNSCSIEVSRTWVYDTGKCVDASPTLFQCNGKTFVTVGSHSGKLISIDSHTGVPYGVVSLNSRIEASVFCYQKLNDHEIGVVGTYDGTIVCFLLNNCSLLWEINIGCMIKSKSVVCFDKLYVASYDGNIRCINIDNGEINTIINISEHPISADLIVAQNYILIGTLAGVCAAVHAKTNSIAWRIKLSSPVFANPVIYDNEMYAIFSEVNGVLHCYNVINGDKVWKFEGADGNIFSSVSIKPRSNNIWSMVFGCHDNYIYCIEVKLQKPTLSWTLNTHAPVYATPSIINNIVVAISTKGKLFFVDLKHGSVLHEYKLDGEIFSSPAVNKDHIFVGCRNDKVYALKYNVVPTQV